MSAVITIILDDLIFYAFHGLYAEEKKIGNQFKVKLIVNYIPVVDLITNIKDTVNYVQLYEIIKEANSKPTELLETWVMEVAKTIHNTFASIKYISLSITKLHPPIPGFEGNISVQYSQDY